MNPTREETDAALLRIQMETDQDFFRSLGEQNRRLTGERIAEYRALTVDDLIETRVTGQNSRWPIDPDTTMRLQGLHHAESDGRLPVGALIAVLAIVVALLGIGLLVTGRL